MIIGVGTDLVVIERMEQLWARHGTRALARMLTEPEREMFQSARQPARFLAMRFAGKEAVAKALGTGFRGPVTLQTVSILRNRWGKPTVTFAEGLEDELERRHIQGVELSLTDAGGLALAFAVAWGEPRHGSGRSGSHGSDPPLGSA